ncbi:peptidylprolyl isomerase [Reichenbachiella agarivorans]|uniref:Peptidyl-prolyl cis-trans isomerase n=1 Tax=Reichenbachiella agarivorans TaxID=2979464 RepID=A0ABY6CS42_9BACT|nr:peptidylprolyl isomerase [Reichenbachiella agarivorans]UXP33341.1 peptidylprolyl isomerase [Reichenbachiella agarivorans]
MKKQFTLLLMMMVILVSCASNNKDYIVTIHTSFGDMKVLLYDETPLHKANFIDLAESGQYDSTIFHRVIKDFMIQGGGIDTKNGTNSNKTIPAELAKGYIHEKGALAAARMGDNVNPERASSWCQFYIVQGTKYTKEEIDQYEEQMNMGKKNQLFGEIVQKPENKQYLDSARMYQKQGNQAAVDSIIALVMEQVEADFTAITLTDQQKETYVRIGGAPHLDNEYTVFGKVVEGLDIIDQIAAIETGRGDKPTTDYFITMDVEKLSKKKITKLYGYEYPEKE